MCRVAAFFIVVILFLLSCSSLPKADKIIYNAKVYTINNTFDMATCIVVKDGKFIEVGSDTLKNKYASTEVIDAKQQCIYPGFIDAHCHFTGYANDMYKFACFFTTSYDELIKNLVAYADTNKRIWIEGRGWDQNGWAVKSFPTKDTLDKLFPDKPIFLVRIDGHAALCNQKALDISNVTTNSTVEGGFVEVKNGKMTGILLDNAMELVRKHIPTLSQNEFNYFIDLAEKECVGYGLTSVQEAGTKYAPWLHDLYNNKKLDLNVSVYLTPDTFSKSYFEKMCKLNNDKLKICGYKVYADGALGSHGALLKKSYTDEHETLGLNLISSDSLKKLATIAYDIPNCQMMVHAIGDDANLKVLSIFSSILKTKNDRRWRIEHVQVLDKNDTHLFGDYSIVPSMQPTHATSDMYWADERLGDDRLQSAYRLKELYLQNNWIPLSTDFPVEYINPLYTFCSAVFRQDAKDFPANGFQTENALSKEQALRGMTIWAAKASFEENVKGSIEIGKRADFIMMSTNLMTASRKEIYDAKINATYIGGVKAY
jgi:predicted amidohydrolase YtcJ